MVTKVQTASAEEYVFTQEVNKALEGSGARVNAFTMVDQESGATRHGLTFQFGPKRHTITSDAPFHYDPPSDIVERVRRWLSSSGTNNLYSPDTKYAD